jgi:hypothetical protein
MDNLPIYQTRSTRVLYPRRRWPRRLLLALGVGALLIAVGALLGQSFLARAEVVAQHSPLAPPVPATVTAGVTRAEPAGEAPARADRAPHLEPAPTASAASPLQAHVAGTEGLGLLLRAAPDTGSQPLAILPEGALVTLAGETLAGPDRAWVPVRDAAGSEGWVAAEYLAPLLE